MSEKIAVVRIRGIRNMKPKIRKTLEILKLNKPNQCILVNDTPEIRGMIKIIKDYVAYGKISQDIAFKLFKKRGEKGGKLLRKLYNEEEIKKMVEKVCQGEPLNKHVDPVFRLHPPRKGYKNIKIAYPLGDLGKREDMDQLVKRMM